MEYETLIYLNKGKWVKVDGDLYLLTEFDLFQITKELRLTYSVRLHPCLVGRSKYPEAFQPENFQRAIVLCGRCVDLTHARQLIERHIRRNSARVMNSYIRSLGYPAEAGTKGSVR